MIAAKTVIQTARLTPVFQNSTVKPHTTSSSGKVTAAWRDRSDSDNHPDSDHLQYSPHWNLQNPEDVQMVARKDEYTRKRAQAIQTPHQ